MTTPNEIVIVGAGLAGAKTAQALRENSFDGKITLIGNEAHRPYERPPLSKDYLQRKVDRGSLDVHEPGYYARHHIDLRTDTCVSAIDRATHQVVLADGGRIAYDRLVLATGATPRRLPLPGADAQGVRYLRSVDDSDQLRDTLSTAAQIAIVGGGWIGLEVAAAARAAGVEASVVVRAPLPLVHILGPQIAQIFADLHRSHGVDLRLHRNATEITTRDGAASGLRLDDGTHVDADAVLIAAGAVPDTSLAEQAGLAVDDGVLTDSSLRSSDPHIYAVGDIARAEHPLLGTRIRVEHWANALHQPATAAASILDRPARYDRLPYFYTDQFELSMEYTGYSPPGATSQVVIRGNPDQLRFIAFWVREQRVLAAMNVNVWDVTDPITQLIRQRTPIDTARLADPTMPLTDAAASRTE
ncbi:NAD(P)/FAD-dependent oxidoreductase [Nocardia sp. NPDC051052]|uniref:NAD(P)/FAD-dependent oxidoreductase n=1 Tax=Nocardia sp. NPDC051052 TaxID=3364322 RepID=UPI003791E8D0